MRPSARAPPIWPPPHVPHASKHSHHRFPGFWKNVENHKEVLNELSAKLHISSLNDWYSITNKDFFKEGARSLLACYHHNIYTLLSRLHPEHKWLPWKFERVPSGFWNSSANRRSYFDWLAKELDIKSPDDWYKIKYEDVKKYGGAALLGSYYDHSLPQALQSVYPEQPWIVWKFNKLPNKYWDNIKNQKEFLDSFAKSRNITPWEAWYDVRAGDLLQAGVGALLNRYGQSTANMLKAVYPEHPWDEWKFPKAPAGHWAHMESLSKYFESLANELTIKQLDDWYQYTSKDLLRVSDRASSVLQRYQGSLILALQYAYPHHNWLIWKFKKVPKGWWNVDENVVTYLKWFTEQAGIKKLDDWYHVSYSQLPSALLDRFGGLPGLLSRYYPDHMWTQFSTASKPLGTGSKMQRYLTKTISSLFPTEEIITEYKSTELVFQKTSRGMYIDIFIPSLSLGFEYQGQQHYYQNPLFGDVTVTQRRDAEKSQALRTAGITLITVPFWWDRTPTSLMATIKKYQPQIQLEVPLDAKSIPGDIPTSVAESMAGRSKSLETFPVPYIVTIARTRGVPKCRGCNRAIKNRGELRIQAKGVFVTYPIMYSICLKEECLEKALKGFQERGKGMFLPSFEQKMAVHPSAAAKFEEWRKQSRSFQNIQWILLQQVL